MTVLPARVVEQRVGVDLVQRESRSLAQRLRLWTPARYAAATSFGTRADLVRHLAQALADAAADLEGAPRRRLPLLDSDLGVADQLAVTADDVVRAQPGPDVARELTVHLLAHRHDLLDDQVPATIAAALGCSSHDQVIAAGRAVCAAG